MLIVSLLVALTELPAPPKAAYCEERFQLPGLVAACDSTCRIVDCGSGRCPTCPVAPNIVWSAWGSYRCDNGKSMSIWITAIGKRRVQSGCWD
jgi:hypothetical protein